MNSERKILNLINSLIDKIKNLNNLYSNIGKVYYSSPSGFAVSVRTQTKIASLKLQAGTYIITSSNVWGADLKDVFILSALQMNNTTVCIERGTMIGGGGVSLATIVTKDSEFTIDFIVYWGNSNSSGTVRVDSIKISAIRII